MKIKWYSFLVPNEKNTKESLLKTETPDQLKSNILIQWELEYRKYSLFNNYISFERFFSSVDEDKRCFYEAILGDWARKPYFDIDIYLEENEDRKTENECDDIANTLVSILDKKIKQRNSILVFTSHIDNKYSYHIVVNYVYLLNNKHSKFFYDEIIKEIPEEMKQYIDKAIYSKLQLFRILGCHKKGKKNIKVLSEKLSRRLIKPNKVSDKKLLKWTMAQSLVSHIVECKELKDFDMPEDYLKPKNFTSGTSSEKDLEEILKIFYSKFKESTFKYHDIVCENGNLLILFLRLEPSYCNTCSRIHQNENPFVIVSGTHRNVYFSCRRNTEGKKELIGSLGINEEISSEEEIISEEEISSEEEIKNSEEINKLIKLSITKEKNNYTGKKHTEDILKNIFL